MLPIALAVLAIILFVFKRSIFKQWQKTIVTSLIAAGIVILPLFLFGLKYPGDVFVARSSVSFTNPELNKGKPLQTLGDTLVKTALMFNVHGDENYRHNLGGKPQLDPITGLLFLVGLLLCLRYFYRMRYLALLGLFGAMLVPEFVTAEGIPHALRAIGAMPTVFIIAALGLRSIWRWLSKTLSNQGRQRVSWALGLLLAVVGYFGYNQYFVAWANDPETYAAYSEDMVAAAYYMNNNPASGPRIAVVHGFGDITIQYLTHKHVSYQRLDPHGIDELPANLDNYQFVIDKAFADEALSKLYARYPSGRQEAHFSAKTGDLLFYTFAEQQ
jgi:hypothetical protein